MNDKKTDTDEVPNIPFAKVDCSGNELQYVREVLESGWLTTASKAHRLEQVFVDMVGCKHAITVNSCTSALHLALDACGIGPGDKVILPSLTFTATAEVVRYMGAELVLVDVDAETGCISLPIIEAALAEHPEAKAVIAVHYGGYPIEMDGDGGLATFCEQKGVRLISDAAHALPAKRDMKYIGASGDITCFSFYANKTMTTGEGGMLLTDSDEIASRARLMRLHGIDRDVWNRFTEKKNGWEYDVLAPGFKYNMPDINAAVGLAQFERLEDMRLARQHCAAYYAEAFSGMKEISFYSPDVKPSEHAWHLWPILLTNKARVDRDTAIEMLANAGVGTSVHYKPIHNLTYYNSRYSFRATDYPVTEKIWKSTISLPIYNLLTKADMDHVINSVKAVVTGT